MPLESSNDPSIMNASSEEKLDSGDTSTPTVSLNVSDPGVAPAPGADEARPVEPPQPGESAGSTVTVATGSGRAEAALPARGPGSSLGTQARLRPGGLDFDPNTDPDFARRYEIQSVLGRGGMGVVYSGVQRVFNRSVAIKFVLSVGEKQLRRFQREGALASKLDHPNVVRVLDGGEVGGNPFLVMEFVDGMTLQDHLVEQGGRLPVAQVVQVLDQVLDGLAAIHALGTIHRDLKPGNIFIARDGVAKIGDFGLAWNPEASQVTATGDLLGTPLFMSPEQFRGMAEEPSSDLYSLGVIMFYLLTGRPPFEEQTFLGYSDAHIRKKPPGIRSLDPSLPILLEELVEKALSKYPADRPRTALHFKRLLHDEPADWAERTAACEARPGDAPRLRGDTIQGEGANAGGESRKGSDVCCDRGLEVWDHVALAVLFLGLTLAGYAYHHRTSSLERGPEREQPSTLSGGRSGPIRGGGR